MRIDQGGGQPLQALQGGQQASCPNCYGQACQACQKGLEASRAGDQNGMRDILELLRALMKADPEGVARALQDNPQFAQAVSPSRNTAPS
jgi:hypothetical protein